MSKFGGHNCQWWKCNNQEHKYMPGLFIFGCWNPTVIGLAGNKWLTPEYQRTLKSAYIF